MTLPYLNCYVGDILVEDIWQPSLLRYTLLSDWNQTPPDSDEPGYLPHVYLHNNDLSIPSYPPLFLVFVPHNLPVIRVRLSYVSCPLISRHILHQSFLHSSHLLRSLFPTTYHLPVSPHSFKIRLDNMSESDYFLSARSCRTRNHPEKDRFKGWSLLLVRVHVSVIDWIEMFSSETVFHFSYFAHFWNFNKL